MACRAMEHVWGTLALAVVSRGVSKPFSLQSIDRTYTEIIRNLSTADLTNLTGKVAD